LRPRPLRLIAALLSGRFGGIGMVDLTLLKREIKGKSHFSGAERASQIRFFPKRTGSIVKLLIALASLPW